MLSLPVRTIVGAFFLLFGGPTPFVHSAPRARIPSAGDVSIPASALVLPPARRGGRSPVRVDPVLASVVDGTWSAPKEGDEVQSADGTNRAWRVAQMGDDGSLKSEQRAMGYAYIAISSETDQAMVLEATGHEFVYVNGEPRTGDVYGNGYVHLPVHLRAGTNHFLFAGSGRGGFRFKLTAPQNAMWIDKADATLPDLVADHAVQTWGAVLIVNNSSQAMADRRLRATLAGSGATTTPIPALPPFSHRKVAFRLEGQALHEQSEPECEIAVLDGDGSTVGEPAQFKLAVRAADQKRRVTFRSEIDGSIQYYGFVPAQNATASPARPGLILTLHGAGVEGIGQANVYSSKAFAHVVAPTNRRPYGFDWEDWGRLDALEVLELAQKELGTDRRRTYLTGHSMGGHGTWILGATYPDRFAAIAPSAGWVSMASYAGMSRSETPSPVAAVFQRASSPSDTLALAPNYAQDGVYVLHGDADDNVPVAQARSMRKVLGEFHSDFVYYERPGAGHWWGNECCDWPPLVDFLSRHERPRVEDVRSVAFRTPSPGVSAWCHWVGIEDQVKPLTTSTVDLRHDPEKRRFTGSTTNVARLSLDLAHMSAAKPISVTLDGQTIDAIEPAEGATRVWLQRDKETWKPVAAPSLALKGPHRYGPFKDAFRNRMQFVYGTRGTPDENAWAFAKARYDAEVFWYRGNGSIDVVPDSSFDPTTEPDRNVILYGNSESNSAWDPLLATSPVQVRRGLVKAGSRTLEGDDLACLFLQPRPKSDRACVGVVSGTGVSGMRLSDALPYFVSGVGYPDLTILSPEILTKGISGVKAAGFFGSDWSVASGELVWAD
jgi:dienelactone hydrolase